MDGAKSKDLLSIRILNVVGQEGCIFRNRYSGTVKNITSARPTFLTKTPDAAYWRFI